MFWQIWLPVQAWLQLPQFFESVRVSASQPSARLPLQLAVPSWVQVSLQVPLTQLGVELLGSYWQTLPQVPRLLTLNAPSKALHSALLLQPFWQVKVALAQYCPAGQVSADGRQRTARVRVAAGRGVGAILIALATRVRTGLVGAGASAATAACRGIRTVRAVCAAEREPGPAAAR